ncbi:hypothetical protein HPP92_025390 [Vanilla planifolia]|uniref:Transducin/WD40 repeat-like superfamily protein n=2 Tax=Vanilla planifolia TaxID=51239 RepID=A0A835UB00_VANPL|nr:hypothetical protein HPP92_025390 [Vanilla planifolia]
MVTIKRPNPNSRNPPLSDASCEVDNDKEVIEPSPPGTPLGIDSTEPLSDDAGVLIGPPRPHSFQAETESDDDAMIGPTLPLPPLPGKYDKEAGEEMMVGPPRSLQATLDDESDSDLDDLPMEESSGIPLSNEIVLKGHSRIVSALAVDHSGSRVLSGSYDYTVRMYDFHGMTSKLQSFRQLEPYEGHQVRSLSWSPTSDRFLCVTGSAQAKIYDRDGLTLGEFIKGDMYIRDLKNTKGHISGLTGGEWNPKSKETILTSSEDGSLRIWDINDLKSQKQVIKPKLARPMRIPVTACAWDQEGKRIVGAAGDGSIQLWNIKPGWGSRPDLHVEKAHIDDVSGLKFSVDGLILLSRSMDSTLKVWDLRQMRNPIKIFDNLPNHYPQTNASFSPDEQLIFTGSSVEKEYTGGGMLFFYDRRKLELVSRIVISPHQSVVRCAWHSKINQIFATLGDKKEGETHILYDPSISKRGALVCAARAPRKKSVDDYEVQPVIHNPHALPLFRDQPSRKRQREKILTDPMKSHKPEVPVTGPGFGGRVGTTKGSLLTQYLMKQGGLIKETWMEEDPREAILKYADVAAKDPVYIAPAYAETQPKPVFAEPDKEDEKKS